MGGFYLSHPKARNPPPHSHLASPYLWVPIHRHPSGMLVPKQQLVGRYSSLLPAVPPTTSLPSTRQDNASQSPMSGTADPGVGADLIYRRLPGLDHQPVHTVLIPSLHPPAGWRKRSYRPKHAAPPWLNIKSPGSFTCFPARAAPQTNHIRVSEGEPSHRKCSQLPG